MKRIIVAGSTSPLAQALLPLLAADERIEQIIGIDRVEMPWRHERFTQVLLDVRSPQVARVMAGADAVVHLTTAAAPDDTPGRIERRAQRDPQVHAGQNVFRCAAQQNVGCVVHVSSAAVYELPARRRPIDEQHPRAALPGFGWAEEQVALESWLDTFEQEHDAMRIVRLRPHLMVGAHGAPGVRRLLGAPFSIRLAANSPQLQCVHALDVARAIQQALHNNVAGAFNLACADSATLPEMQQRRRGGLIPLPFPLAYRLVQLATRGNGGKPAWMEGLRHEIVLDTSRARRRLGWKPQYDSVQACLEATD